MKKKKGKAQPKSQRKKAPKARKPSILDSPNWTSESSVRYDNEEPQDSSSPLEITTEELPNGEVGTEYNASVSATGGMPPYEWSASNLPPGLAISASGVIEGAPTITGPDDVILTVTDSASSPNEATKTLTIEIGENDPCDPEGQFEGSVTFDDSDVTIEKVSQFPSLTNPIPTAPMPEVDVVCDGGSQVWRARVSSAFCIFSQTIGTPSKVLTLEILATTNCELLEDIWDDLQYFATNVAGGVGRWCPEGFFQVHENVHLALFRKSIATHYPEFVSAIEAITLPCSDYDNTQARAEMANAILKAKKDFRNAWDQDRANNADHLPREDFLAAQQAFLKSWLDLVDLAGVSNGCWIGP